MSQATENQQTTGAVASHNTKGHHAMNQWVLVAVWLALIILTYFTVSITYIDLGPLNLVMAMVIATIKASLVLLFFMHLLYDNPFNSVVFIGALLFLALFVILALIDTTAYQPDLIEGFAPALQQR